MVIRSASAGVRSAGTGPRGARLLPPAEAAGIAVLLAALAMGLRPVTAAACGLLAAGALAVPVRGRTLTDAAALRICHLLMRRGLGAASPPGRAHGGHATPLVPASTGFRFDGDELVCAVQVHPRHGSIVVTHPGRSVRPAGAGGGVLEPSTVAALLHQFDIRLSGIDIHTRARRTCGPPPVQTVVSRLIGPLTALARRDTLLLIRLDPALCPDAVERRGGGVRGAVRTAGVAAARIIRALEARGLSCTTLTPADLDAAVPVFLGEEMLGEEVAGPGSFNFASGAPESKGAPHRVPAPVSAQPATPTPEPRWDCAVTRPVSPLVPASGIVHTSYRLPAATLQSHDAATAFDTPCASAVMTMRLRPAGDAGLVRVDGLLRYSNTAGTHAADRTDAGGRTAAPHALQAQKLAGSQVDALWATSPRGGNRFENVGGTRKTHCAAPVRGPSCTPGTALSGAVVESATLAPIELGGHGQLLGGDRAGGAVFGTLVGPRVQSLEIAGPVYVARQVVLRALATGARILVLTDRPGEWRHLESEVADRTALRVEPTNLPEGSVFGVGPADGLGWSGPAYNPEPLDVGGAAAHGPGQDESAAEVIRRYGTIVLDRIEAAAPMPLLGIAPRQSPHGTVRPACDPGPYCAVVPADATVALVLPAASGTAPDAAVHQDPDSPDTLHIRIHNSSCTVTMVSLPDESRLIGRP